MATRKLKFKPKPILGSNVRRLPVQDNDEISIPTTSTTENEPLTSIVKTLKDKDESEIGTSILLTTDSEAGKHLHIDRLITGEKNKGAVSDNDLSECIMKDNPLLRTDILPVRENYEISVPTSSTTENKPLTSIVETLKDKDESEIGTSILLTTDSEADKHFHIDRLITGGKNKGAVSDNDLSEFIIKDNPSVCKDISIIENTITSVTIKTQQLPESDCQPSVVGCGTIPNPSANKEDNEVEAGNNNLKTNSVPVKVEILKGLSRFGRSRCKPVLTCGPRKTAISVSNEPKLDNESVVERTGSVIKSVQSELTTTPGPSGLKVNSLSKISNEILNQEDGSNSSMDNAREINTGTIRTKELVANKSNALELVPSTATDVSDLSLLKQIQSKDHSGSSDAIISKPNQSEISNQPSEAVQQCNAKEVESSNAIQSVQTPKVPLSPLRTTSKILVPKPSPRLRDGIRRISFQGSDSEEDSKRKLTDFKGKDKKDDLKIAKRKKSQGSTYSKMGEETLEKFYKKFGKDGKPDKSKLTMMDLIFYNPKDNPMSKTQPKVQTSAGKKEIKTDVSDSREVSETLAEQSVDDVEPAQPIPVPQLKIGPDGQIMLDPKSLVIETTGMQKSREELEKSQVIQESGITRYSTYSKRRPRRSDWSPVETLQFYKALSTIGPDFTLMTQLFPKRNRHDLKLKFKKEDKLNRQLVDKAMTGQADFDFKTLQEELKLENEEIERKRIEKELYEKQKKEERLKAIAEKKQTTAEKKENKNYRPRRRKTPCSIEILDTDEDISDEESEKCKQTAMVKRAKRRRTVHKKLKQSVSDVENDIVDVGSPKKDADSSLTKTYRPKSQGPNKTRKLNEYHEMNESLKKNLCSELAAVKSFPDSEPEDQYTPNGPGALFRSPPNAAEHTDNDEWHIDVASVPPIDETALRNNIETVSEISELGSFGQDSDTALDLSMTDRTLEHRPYLDRRIISESIEIVGQLSSHVDNKMCARKTHQSDNEEENILPLPSFETVIGMRSPFRYPLEAAKIVTPSEVSDVPCVEIRTSTEDFEMSDYHDQSELILGD